MQLIFKSGKIGKIQINIIILLHFERGTIDQYKEFLTVLNVVDLDKNQEIEKGGKVEYLSIIIYLSPQDCGFG